MKFIIYNPETKLFDFFINNLIKEFKILNIEVVNYFDKNIIINYTNDIILIIIDPHFIFDYKHIEEEVVKISKEYKFKILYITEPINFLIEKTIYTNLIKKINPYCLWTYTFENFNKLNIPQKIFKIFPGAYLNKFIEVNLKNLKERNINNIIFIGNITENRIKICNEFNNFLINKTSAWTMEEWKSILINNLFYLNIHRRNNCKSFETFRIVPILANGGVIFSERCNMIEENLYQKYNIFFIDKNNIYNFFLEFIKNINYNDIYKKYISFLEDSKSNLNSYLSYHQLCAKVKL